MVDDLLSLEPECKWALATAVFLHATRQPLQQPGGASTEQHSQRLAALQKKAFSQESSRWTAWRQRTTFERKRSPCTRS